MSVVKAFTVCGPYKIPVQSGCSGKYFEADCGEFWDNCPDIADQWGCYVFAIRNSTGFKPVYVGKATKSFRRECFQPHKVACHYQPALAHLKKGTPVMFFLVTDSRRSQRCSRSIAELELYLIKTARMKNPELSNVIHNKDERWEIVGVTSTQLGKPTRATSAFRRALGV